MTGAAAGGPMPSAPLPSRTTVAATTVAAGRLLHLERHCHGRGVDGLLRPSGVPPPEPTGGWLGRVEPERVLGDEPAEAGGQPQLRSRGAVARVFAQRSVRVAMACVV